MSQWYRKDIGASLNVAGGIHTSFGATNEAELNGSDYNRRSDGTLRGIYDGAMAVVFGSATLQSGATLAFIGNYQHGDATNAYTDVGDALSTTIVATGPTGGGAVGFALKFPSLDMSKCKRFVRFQVTGVFSATGTDTAVFAGGLVVGGPQNVPAN